MKILRDKDNQISAVSTDHLDIGVVTALGAREKQEDCFGFQCEEDNLLLCVCDGMGGAEKGEIASGLAVREMLNTFSDICSGENIITTLEKKVKECDDSIFNLKNEKGEAIGAGTTIVAVAIHNNDLYWNAVGDSRLYILRKNSFAQMTNDQNYRKVLEEKLSAGLITEQELSIEKKKSDMLINYLGIGSLSLMDQNESAFQLLSGDILLLCTDGLYRLIEDSSLAGILLESPNIETALRWFEKEARVRSAERKISRDNMTAAVIRIK